MVVHKGINYIFQKKPLVFYFLSIFLKNKKRKTPFTVAGCRDGPATHGAGGGLATH